MYAPAPQQSMGGGIMSSKSKHLFFNLTLWLKSCSLLGVVSGMALGAGSAIGRSVVNSAIGAFSGGSSSDAPKAVEPVPMSKSGPCDSDQTAFIQCMQINKSNASQCDMYFSALQSCQSMNSGN